MSKKPRAAWWPKWGTKTSRSTIGTKPPIIRNIPRYELPVNFNPKEPWPVLDEKPPPEWMLFAWKLYFPRRLESFDVEVIARDITHAERLLREDWSLGVNENTRRVRDEVLSRINAPDHAFACTPLVRAFGPFDEENDE